MAERPRADVLLIGNELLSGKIRDENGWYLSQVCRRRGLELREIAVARLMLDNVPHVKAYWILMDVPIAQLCLAFGADDVDGTVVEEKIYHEAGATTPQEVERAELIRWIRDAGRVPVERDTLYNVVWADDAATEATVGAAAPLGV